MSLNWKVHRQRGSSHGPGACLGSWGYTAGWWGCTSGSLGCKQGL